MAETEDDLFAVLSAEPNADIAPIHRHVEGQCSLPVRYRDPRMSRAVQAPPFSFAPRILLQKDSGSERGAAASRKLTMALKSVYNFI